MSQAGSPPPCPPTPPPHDPDSRSLDGRRHSSFFLTSSVRPLSLGERIPVTLYNFPKYNTVSPINLLISIDFQLFRRPNLLNVRSSHLSFAVTLHFKPLRLGEGRDPLSSTEKLKTPRPYRLVWTFGPPSSTMGTWSVCTPSGSAE